MHSLWDVITGLEDKECLSFLPELHGIVLCLIIDPECHLLLVWPQEGELPESHMERRTCQRSIFLLNDYNINGTAKGGRVDRIPCFGD